MAAARFRRADSALKAGKIDLVISSLSMTPERAKAIDFTRSYYTSPSQYAALKSSGITDDPATLKGKVVGVQSGTIHEAYMEKMPDIQSKAYNTVQEAELRPRSRTDRCPARRQAHHLRLAGQGRDGQGVRFCRQAAQRSSRHRPDRHRRQEG